MSGRIVPFSQELVLAVFDRNERLAAIKKIAKFLVCKTRNTTVEEWMEMYKKKETIVLVARNGCTEHIEFRFHWYVKIYCNDKLEKLASVDKKASIKMVSVHV